MANVVLGQRLPSVRCPSNTCVLQADEPEAAEGIGKKPADHICGLIHAAWS